MIEHYEKRGEIMEVWKKMGEDDWKKVVGVLAGIEIYNYLNPMKGNSDLTVVKFNYIPSNEEFVDGRYRVVIGVQFLVKALVQHLLKPSSRHTPDPLNIECDV